MTAPRRADSIRPLEPQPSPSSARPSEQVLDGLCLVVKLLDGFAPEQDTADSERALATSQALHDLVTQTTQHLQHLEQLNPTPDDDSDSDLQFAAEPPTVDGLPIVVPTLPRLADVCFAATFELNRASAQLSRVQSLEDAWVAQETALRKLRRAIRAVIESAEESGLRRIDAGELLRHRSGIDLATTLALRRLYADFRRALRRPLGDSPEAVLTALRYAAGALATLISSADYAHARVWDRANLRRLQQRLFAWAHSGKLNDRGLELLDDICTTADLLRGINRRQELRLHDADLIERLCTNPPFDDPEHWQSDLQSLFGLDDQLDTLIDRSRRAPSRPLIDELLQRLTALR